MGIKSGHSRTPATYITIHRSRLVESGFQQLSSIPSAAMKGVIRVNFVNMQVHTWVSLEVEHATFGLSNVAVMLFLLQISITSFYILLSRVWKKLELMKWVFSRNFWKKPLKLCLILKWVSSRLYTSACYDWLKLLFLFYNYRPTMMVFCTPLPPVVFMATTLSFWSSQERC